MKEYDIDNDFFSKYERSSGKGIVKEFLEHFDCFLCTIPKGTIFYRSRIVDKRDVYRKLQLDDTLNSIRGLPADEMLLPPASSSIKTGANRCSPAGSRVLYIAKDPYTAVSEINPYWCATVSVATLITNKEIQIFAPLSQQPDSIDFRTEAFKKQFVKAYAKHSTYPEDYLATQYLTYLLRKHQDNCAGIEYMSFKSCNGRNLALFDEGCVDFVESETVRCTGVEYCLQYLSKDTGMMKPNKKYEAQTENEMNQVAKDIVKAIKAPQ